MQAAQILAGYTLGGADLLRRAMGKKKVEEMQQQRETFVKGCAKTNNIPAAKANAVFDLLEKFAGYGFNKSHAAAYAIVAYQTAYLKANYPVEFLAAMMTNDMGTTEKLTIVLNEAKSMSVEVLPPDVNEGQQLFAPSPNGKGIRFGLAAIKGVGEVAVQAIIKAREEGGKFESLGNLCERVDTRTVSRKTIEALIKCGACDCFRETRASMFASIDRVLARASEIAYDRQRGQSSMFGMMEESAPAKKTEAVAQLSEWPQHELLAHEKELLGFYVTGHPMTPFAPLLEKYCLHNSVTAKTLPPRTLTRLGGMISAVQQGFSKKSGKPYAMITLEDLEGTVSMLCMNENYDKFRELLVQGKALLVVGEVNNDEDRAKLFPQEIMPLEDAPKKYTKQVHHASTPRISRRRTCRRPVRFANRTVAACRPSSACAGRAAISSSSRRTRIIPSLPRNNSSRPWTISSARRPITPRWTPRCPSARSAHGSARRRTGTSSYEIARWRNSPGLMPVTAAWISVAATRIRRRSLVDNSRIGMRRPARFCW